MSYDGLWIEDYRFTKLDDCIGQEKIVEACKNFIKKGQYPHLILSGPAGVGKTSIAYILAKSISGFGKTMILNASDENSIEIVRTTIKEFARTEGEHIEIFKTIILDEGDNISPKAQQALRRIMEIYGKYCRMIFTCNYSNKIIEPIKSRCIEFVFGILPRNKVISRLLYIAKQHNLDINVKQIKYITSLHSNDMRKCINILNSIQMGAPIESLINFINPIKYLKFIPNNDLKLLRDYIDENIYSGNDLRFLIKKCIDVITKNIGKGGLEKIGIKDPHKLLMAFTEADYRLAMGSQYYSVAFWILLFYNNN